MSAFHDSSISILDVAVDPDEFSACRVKPVVRRVIADCLSADEVDAQWDRVNETMSTQLRRVDEELRSQSRASWRVSDEVARQNSKQRLNEIAEHRRRQRELYDEAMENVGLLREKHIELLEWALNATRAGWQLSREIDSNATLCKSFVIVLDDGEEVIPYRKRPRGRDYAAFFVSNSGNKRENALDVFTEAELRRLVIGLGYRVYCRNQNGTRTGLYTAQSPNRVRFLES